MSKSEEQPKIPGELLEKDNPENNNPIEKTGIEKETDLEISKVEANAKGLEEDLKTLESGDLQEQKDKTGLEAFANKVRMLIVAAGALAAIPLVSTFLGPEKFQQLQGVMQVSSGSPLDNIGSLIAAVGALSVSAVLYKQIRKEKAQKDEEKERGRITD